MALGLVGLGSNHPVTVRGAQVISESFPEFIEILLSFGADLAQEP
jgi:5-enolpyruvylshikimate-3-phosphate synthase